MPPNRLTDALDSFLEASVVASWSNIGIRLRRAAEGWPAPDLSRLAGRRVLVTGGTSGIGRAVAEAIVAAGAHVEITGRDPARTSAVADRITAASPHPEGRALPAPADLSTPAEVAALADRVAEGGPLSGLVHAAGIMEPAYVRSGWGVERTAAVHVLAPHALTRHLAPSLRDGAPGAVVWVSSGGMYAHPVDPTALARVSGEGYRPARAYAAAKRAQVVLAAAWDELLAPDGVRSVAMHPGWVDTAALRTGLPGFATALAPLLRRPDEGADTVLWLLSGAAREAPGGGIWLDRRRRSDVRGPRRAIAPGTAERLWAWAETGCEVAR